MAHFSELDTGLSGTGYSGPVQAAPRTGGPYQLFLKRTLDLVVVLLAAPFVLPVLFGLGLLIRRDGGSMFYCQQRIGRGGKVFRLWKLRSMVVDADRKLEAYLHLNPAARAEWDEHQKLKHDPRVTAAGRLIRKASLDELPQLWNVLVGDMSLVGPRPMMPQQAELYPGRDYYRLRPGLTGLWQISDRTETSFAARAAYDTQYCRRLSLLTDLLVLLATVWVVIRGTGY